MSSSNSSVDLELEELPDIIEEILINPNQSNSKVTTMKDTYSTETNCMISVPAVPGPSRESSCKENKNQKNETKFFIKDESSDSEDEVTLSKNPNRSIISESEDSDLDADLVQLAGTSSKKDSNGEITNEISLISEDEDDNNNPSTTTTSTTASTNESHSRYGLRTRKRNLNYSDLLESSLINSDEEKVGKKLSTKRKKQPMEICLLNNETLQKYIDAPNLLKWKKEWSLNPSHLDTKTTNPTLLTFFKKCSSYCESLFYFKISSQQMLFNFETIYLQPLLSNANKLTKFSMRYASSEDISETLKVVKSQRKQLKLLKHFKLKSILGDGILKKKEIESIIDTQIKFEHLELGDALWEDAGPEALENLLENFKDSLESLTIHGGFKGSKDKSKFIIKFPKMPNLKTISICPKYSFISERKNPLSKKARIVRLDLKEDIEEPFKFVIQFTSDLPQLETLILGNLIEIHELPFAYVRKLKTFKCGSYWNLSIRFPAEGSRQALQGSSVTELQLPDGLKDPTFIPKIAKHFPNLKKVWIALPSVSVLRSFFKNFENSSLEELCLKTQFDFPSTMESCLLPRDSDAYKIDDLTKTQVQTLKEYKWYEDYVRYNNVELPLEEGDLMEGNSAGIRALKSLKVFQLEHIPRILLIPNPEEERKWFDHNCKFLNNTFGYEEYPFSGKCHKEILKMDLDHYTWKNLHIYDGPVNQFLHAGYVTITESEVLRVYEDDEDEEDLFIPIQKKTGVNVAIQPSMLLPDYFKNKQET